MDATHGHAVPDADIVLQARGLRKVFRGFVAVSGVDLDIRRGAIHALIGPNGAGKTTVFNLLTKFLSPTSGRILLEGVEVTAERPAALARLGLVRSFQISAVFPHLTVSENVAIALQRSSVSPVKFWQGRSRFGDMSARIEALLDQVDLGAFAHQRAGDLAYGRKRALELATTLAANPKVMLLDEPTQGLGHEDVDRVTALIKQVAIGRTVVMVEHNMKMVARIADRISVLRRGEIIAEGAYDEVSRDPQVIESYLGSRSRAAERKQ
ncbi:MAG: ABC transporter ATP-binding protein [Afipia sp.]|jgi:branched-chain amino acid transport system ATP-binding protein|nr:ABC transporter ATP-binding protein [Afipia sp.]